MLSSPTVQLLVLAAIAVFLILRLRGVLGTRDGFEAPRMAPPPERPDGDVIEGTAVAVDADTDIDAHVARDSPEGQALAAMKQAEPAFSVSEFLAGARQAYEMIVMAFERGDISAVRPFLAPTVADAFQGVIDTRKAEGQTVEATYLGTRETALAGASFDPASGEAEITVRFVGELTVVTRNAAGEAIDGAARTPRKQRDIWTFARRMGAGDPNWQLVATS